MIGGSGGRSRGLAALLVLASVLPLAALHGRDREPDPASRRRVVAIEGVTFRPAVLRAAVGDTIVWVNRDILAHTATAAAAGIDTGNIPAGESRSVVLESAGEKDYICVYHPGMKGRLIVRK